MAVFDCSLKIFLLGLVKFQKLRNSRKNISRATRRRSLPLKASRKFSFRDFKALLIEAHPVLDPSRSNSKINLQGKLQKPFNLKVYLFKTISDDPPCERTLDLFHFCSNLLVSRLDSMTKLNLIKNSDPTLNLFKAHFCLSNDYCFIAFK